MFIWDHYFFPSHRAEYIEKNKAISETLYVYPNVYYYEYELCTVKQSLSNQETVPIIHILRSLQWTNVIFLQIV